MNCGLCLRLARIGFFRELVKRGEGYVDEDKRLNPFSGGLVAGSEGFAEPSSGGSILASRRFMFLIPWRRASTSDQKIASESYTDD